MSSSHLFLKLQLFRLPRLFSSKRLLFIALRIDRYSQRWKESQVFFTISTCSSLITMSNSTELPDREYIVPLCVLNAFFRFDCCRVEQCNDSCDKENVIGFVAKKSDSIAVESGFFGSQCWIGGSTHLYNPPYFSI